MARRYDWGDGKGKVHSRPKRARAPASGSMGGGHVVPNAATMTPGAPGPAAAGVVTQSVPAATAAPAPAPAATGAPAPAPFVFDPRNPFASAPGDSAATTQGIGATQYGYLQDQGQIQLQRDEILRHYGVTEQADPATGRMYRLDLANNPYSVGARTARQFEMERSGNKNAAASGGYLFDGAYGAVMKDANYREGAATEDILSAVTGQMGSLSQQDQAAFQAAMGQVLGYRDEDAYRRAQTITPGQGGA